MEMFFMAERCEQIKDAVPDWDQLQQPVVIDYLFTKSLLYAQANLDEDEFHVFGKIFDILNRNYLPLISSFTCIPTWTGWLPIFTSGKGV